MTDHPDTSLEGRLVQLLAGDPAVISDPYPLLNCVRDTAPVMRLGDAFVLTRHDHVRKMLDDNNELYSRARNRHSSRYEAARTRFTDEERRAFDAVMDLEFQQLVRLDPPEHPRQRRAIQAAFAPRKLIREMEEVVQSRIDELLDEAAAAGGPVDIKRLAYTLPLRVLGDLLGIPLGDLDAVHGWAHVIGTNKFNAESGQKAIEAERAYRSLYAYIDGLVEQQASSDAPTGLLATLLEAQERGDLMEDELRAMLALLIFAGHETTSNLLAIGLYELMRHRAQWELLCADPSLAPRAAEELLRFVTPALYITQAAIEEHEVGGVTLQPGDSVIGVLASANRDPAVFADPDDLDILRDDGRHHLALGHGPHFCVGAGLARMEANRFFETLASRHPGMVLATEDIAWGGSGSLRTPLALPMDLAS